MAASVPQYSSYFTSRQSIKPVSCKFKVKDSSFTYELNPVKFVFAKVKAYQKAVRSDNPTPLFTPKPFPQSSDNRRKNGNTVSDISGKGAQLISLMATANSKGVFESLPAKTRLCRAGNTLKRATIVSCFSKNQEQIQTFKTTRRLALGIPSTLLFANSAAIAEDNGYWITSTRIPIPPVNNKINNEETGTRSFVKKGLFMAPIGEKNWSFRIYKTAFDLIAMGDLIKQEQVWDYIRRYLRLKSTFMYYDFDKVISAAPAEEKPPLLDLANRLFDNFEKLDDAVKREDRPQTDSYYQDTVLLLQEVMTKMA